MGKPGGLPVHVLQKPLISGVITLVVLDAEGGLVVNREGGRPDDGRHACLTVDRWQGYANLIAFPFQVGPNKDFRLLSCVPAVVTALAITAANSFKRSFNDVLCAYHLHVVGTAFGALHNC